jgi:hypothetical protein
MESTVKTAPYIDALARKREDRFGDDGFLRRGIAENLSGHLTAPESGKGRSPEQLLWQRLLAPLSVFGVTSFVAAISLRRLQQSPPRR